MENNNVIEAVEVEVVEEAVNKNSKAGVIVGVVALAAIVGVAAVKFIKSKKNSVTEESDNETEPLRVVEEE